MPNPYRLVTRSDFDGLICAVLLRQLGIIDDILFVHPKDMQDGKVDVSERDITTNLPYVPGVHLAFDHHASEMLRVGEADNRVIDPHAPSAARVVYDYYGGRAAFPNISDEMMEAVDKADAAQFSKEDITEPSGWVLLNYLMDARTGLGRFRDFRISNYQLMMQLIDECSRLTVDQILQLPDVAERIELYRAHEEPFRAQLERCARVYGPLVVLDLRQEETIYAGNRFMIYAMFPEARVSVHVLWGRDKQNTVFAAGRSILDRSSTLDIGALMLGYSGGGHEAAGTCQVDNADAERVLAELIQRISSEG
jgi:nanoRNase/pAp phosphatase (c-di-AMP/oligoRNAs hydrolase)